MSEPRPEPIAREAYDTLARAYSEKAETKAENGYNEHPAIRAVIGEVKDLCVLDAGCGPGFLMRDLRQAGAARVIGFDVSAEMVAIARERLGQDDDLLIHDLAHPLPFPGGMFDLIVSSLALDYVYDWSGLLSEFHRVLKSEGRLVCSVQHPMGSYRWFEPPTPFGIHYCEADWKGFTDEPVTVPDYYRSFEEIVMPLINAGFQLRGLKETKPVEALKAIHPEKYREGMQFPTFMVLEAKPDGKRVP
jgi:SAM-dependent methyltransferase